MAGRSAQIDADEDAAIEAQLDAILSTLFVAVEVNEDTGGLQTIWQIRIGPGLGEWQWMIRSEAKEFYFPKERKNESSMVFCSRPRD